MCSGLTLFEAVFTVLVIGIITVLALPQYINMVEYSRGMEAFAGLSAIRQSLDRYYASHSSYSGATLKALDIEDPSTDPMAHFTYAMIIPPLENSFTVTATRNTRTGGDNTSSLSITHDGVKSGTGIYARRYDF